MGMKAADKHTIPVCSIHHAAIHADGNETRFLSERGVDGPDLAKRLYAAGGNYGAAVAEMRRWGGNP
jgi:hypothetical protein